MICLTGFLLHSFALGEITIEIFPDEWSWEEGSTSFFHGSIQTDHTVSEAVLYLSVETRLKEAGRIQFLSLNGKKLKTKQRSNSLSTELIEDSTTEFTGQWFLPDEMETDIAYATIRLQALDGDGKEIGTRILEVGSKETDLAMLTNSPVYIIERMMKLFIILAVAFWLTAIGRHLILNLNLKKKGNKNADIQ